MIQFALLLACTALAQDPPPLIGDMPLGGAAAPPVRSLPAALRVASGPAGLYIDVPVNERLVYEVVLDVALLGETRVGSFVLSGGVEPFRQGLPKAGEPVEASLKRAGWIRGEATGGYLGYHLEHTIEARLLPQEWPRVIVRDYQSGSENRRRELMYGVRAGEPTSWYRRDRHCSDCERVEHQIEGGLSFKGRRHCSGCKRGEHRTWDRPKVQPIPQGAIDMVTAIYLARALVRSDEERIDVPLLDKETYWDLALTKGEVRELDSPAGSFTCRAIKIDPAPPSGSDKQRRFKGLFGIHGTLSIWLEERTGVPILIEGDVPLGPLNLDLAIRLTSHRGTPPGFAGH